MSFKIPAVKWSYSIDVLPSGKSLILILIYSLKIMFIFVKIQINSIFILKHSKYVEDLKAYF